MKSNVYAEDGDWFFFHSHGPKIRRTTKSGSWKITGKRVDIKDENSDCIGRKTYLVFQPKDGAIPNNRFTWAMHEYSDASEPLPGQVFLRDFFIFYLFIYSYFHFPLELMAVFIEKLISCVG